MGLPATVSSANASTAHMRIRHLGNHWIFLVLLLTSLCAFFGFGAYVVAVAPVLQVVFYILLACSFVLTVWALLQPA